MATTRHLRTTGIKLEQSSLDAESLFHRGAAKAGSGGGGSIRDLIYTGDPMNGTADDDFMWGFAPTSAVNNVIGGGEGDDLILGDIGNFFFGAGGASFAAAFNLEVPSAWTLDENPLFGDFTIPHATVAYQAVAGQEGYYSFAAGAGETITIDIDYGTSSIGVNADTVVQLIHGVGNVLATNNNASIGRGGLGSSSGFDSYLTFQTAAAGTYFLRVYEPGASPEFEGGETFLINISVSGHAVSPPSPEGNDTLNGHAGDDQIFGVAGADSINGFAGLDFMDGGGGADFLAGNADDDTMRGGDGNDTLNDSEGSNVFDGGLGNDSLAGSGIFEFSGDGAVAETDSVTAFGDNSIVSFAESEVAVTFRLTSAQQGQRSVSFTSNAKIVGSNFDDVWTLSNAGNENLDGGGGSDLLDFRGALLPEFDYSILWDFDTGAITLFDLEGIFGFTFVNFERLIVFPNVTDIVLAGAADNFIDTRDEDDAIEGEGGNDTLVGGRGADLLDGGDGFDWASYETSAGVVANLANAAANTRDAAGDAYFDIEGLIGSITRDSLTGNNLANGLDGGDGVDTLIGAEGNDTLIGGARGDILSGGAGFDTASYANATASVRVNLAAPAVNLRDAAGDSYASIEGLIGSSFGDNFVGNAAANRIDGGGGRDLINGAAANDTLVGGASIDTLTGGAGADRFILDIVTAGHADRIMDFAAGDRIALTAEAIGLPVGALHFERLHFGTAAVEADDRLIYHQPSGRLWFDANGDGAGGQVLIATLANEAPLAAADFVVI